MRGRKCAEDIAYGATESGSVSGNIASHTGIGVDQCRDRFFAIVDILRNLGQREGKRHTLALIRNAGQLGKHARGIALAERHVLEVRVPEPWLAGFGEFGNHASIFSGYPLA